MRERLLLAIESSCDESAVALVRGGREVLAERVASQTAIHAPFGGVIPEVAARAHHEWLPRLLSEVLQEAEGLGVAGEIEGVALTTGPGLVGSLLVGAGIGSAWAWARGLPVLPVNHLEGHLRAAWLREAADVDAPTLPAIGLVVSGGHTLLVRIERDGAMQRLGGTIDDAAGEAFDKIARLLGAPYPGGVVLRSRRCRLRRPSSHTTSRLVGSRLQLSDRRSSPAGSPIAAPAVRPHSRGSSLSIHFLKREPSRLLPQRSRPSSAHSVPVYSVPCAPTQTARSLLAGEWRPTGRSVRHLPALRARSAVPSSCHRSNGAPITQQ